MAEELYTKAPIATYVTVREVMMLLGCKKNKAYEAIRNVNSRVAENGHLPYGQGKANKYAFSREYDIPIGDVNKAIEGV